MESPSHLTVRRCWTRTRQQLIPHFETDSLKAIRAKKIQRYLQKCVITNYSMGHLECLHSVSAERPVKIHSRSVSIELDQTARALNAEHAFQVFSTKQSFCTSIMAARHTDSLFVRAIRKPYYNMIITLVRCRRSLGRGRRSVELGHQANPPQRECGARIPRLSFTESTDSICVVSARDILGRRL